VNADTVVVLSGFALTALVQVAIVGRWVGRVNTLLEVQDTRIERLEKIQDRRLAHDRR